MPILTKRERQDAKLTLADTDRRARNLIEPGRYIDVSADATQLPTRYAVGDNNTNNLVINPNISGLLPGRPWNSTTSVYAILAFEPKLVFDFTGNVFKTGGGISTFSNSITHARAGNATMVDSDGLLKWAPHNLVPYSEDQTQWYLYPATATRTADRITFTTATTDRRAATYSDGIQTVGGLDYKIVADFTVDDGLPVIALGTRSGLYKFAWASYDTTLLTSDDYSVSDTVTNITVDSCVNISGNIWRLTVGYTAGSSVPTAVIVHLGTAGQTASQLRTAGVGTGSCGVTNVHSFRSDLGGMANNPTTSNSYVPTTSSAVYAPRVGHLVYNGSAWVSEGILHESEARTNLMTDSGDLTSADWSWPGGLIVGTVTTGSPFGTHQTISPRSSSAGTGAEQRYQIGKSITSGSTYVTSSLVKYSAGSGWFILIPYDTGSGNRRAWFDLQNGVVGTKDANVLDYGMIDYGDGWWLCWASANVTSTSGGMSVEMPNGDGVRTCTATDVILIAGSQFELGSTPSSYIPTSDSTVARAAETLTVPAANLPYPTYSETTGTELVTNGTFDTDVSGWVAGSSSATSAAVSGEMHVTAGPANGRVVTGVPTIVGRFYQVSGVGRAISGTGGPGATLYLTNSGGGTIKGGIINYTTTDAPLGLTFKATATTSYISAIVMGNGGNVSAFDNISVKEVNPLTLSIQMDGKMTYADDGATTFFYRWLLNPTNYAQTVLQTTGSYEGRIRSSQRETTSGYDEVATSNSYFTPDINVPFNISSRHGSTFLNAAEGGTALTANTTVTALPDLSSADLLLGSIFMGTIGKFRVWDEDLTDAGIVEATEPSTEPSLQLTFDGSSTTSFTVLDWSE